MASRQAKPHKLVQHMCWTRHATKGSAIESARTIPLSGRRAPRLSSSRSDVRHRRLSRKGARPGYRSLDNMRNGACNTLVTHAQVKAYKSHCSHCVEVGHHVTERSTYKCIADKDLASVFQYCKTRPTGYWTVPWRTKGSNLKHHHGAVATMAKKTTPSSCTGWHHRPHRRPPLWEHPALEPERQPTNNMRATISGTQAPSNQRPALPGACR